MRSSSASNDSPKVDCWKKPRYCSGSHYASIWRVYEAILDLFVVYVSKDWVTPTARVFMTLDYLGLGDRTSILDGGLPAWRAEGKPITAELRQPKPGHFTPAANSKLVVDADWVKANLNKPGVAILDARAAKFYTGEEAGQMPRAGHIPSAKN